MGIVYKLKKNVIDFILQKKNENCALSCRQISVLASEKFKIQVSKSSVNTVIKNARLSSSVGRRAYEDSRPKKFQIPSVKKKQLSDNLRKAGFEPAPFERSAPVEEEKVPIDRADADERVEKKTVVPSVVEACPRDASHEKFLECVHRWRETLPEQKGPLLEGMGFVFPKSVEWGLSGASVLGKVLRGYFKDNPPARFEKFCEMLPYLGLLGLHNKEEVGRIKNHALWTLVSGFDQSEMDSFLDWTKEMKLSSTLLMDYANEIGQALLNIHRFTIYLEDGKCVYLDAQLASLWKDKPPDSLNSSLNRSIARLSQSFISNNDPAVFFAFGDESFPLEKAVEMMGGRTSAGKNSIRKIIALDGEGNPVVEFSAIPFRKRSFLVGVWPWQAYFSEFAKYVYWDGYQPFYFKYLDAIFHLKEIKSSVVFGDSKLVENIRVISVLDENKNKPIVVILTNHTQMPAEDLAQTFLLRWPSLDHGPAGDVFQKMNFMQYAGNVGVTNTTDFDSECGGDLSPKNNILALSRCFGEMLQRRCQDQLFRKSKECFWELIGSQVDGYCMFIDNVRRIILSLPSDHPHLKEIKKAALAINESATMDFDGYLLLVQCDVKKIP